MARHKGILNEFSGKIGPVVGATWNGIPYMRTRPAPRSGKPLTDAQKEWQEKFAIGMNFINAMGPLVNISYQSGYGKTAKNAALSRLLSQAIGGRYPQLYLDYTQVEIARGELKKAANPAVAFTEDKQLRFTWTDNTGLGNAAATDQAILVAYCPETNYLIYNDNGGLRGDGQGLLDARLLMNVIEGRGYALHTWMSFRDKKGERVADGVWVGEFQI
ncbi:MAG: hypothetical protein J0M10_09860 [Chitinophagales bacterium]|jgi:hypothetical protein|nr:hypothetical protein [Chitinophagales bacterium]